MFLALRNPEGNLVDTVEIGGDSESSDYGGDGQDNGAPGAQDGDALGLYDEAVARVPDGVDTGNELTDWAKQRATLGRSNDLDPPVDSTPPTVASFVITRQVGGKARADTDLLLTFSEPMNLGTIRREGDRPPQQQPEQHRAQVRVCAERHAGAAELDGHPGFGADLHPGGEGASGGCP